MHSIDSRRSLTAIIVLAVIGPCVFILQPGFVQGLIEHVGYNEVQAANIVATEMFALAVATIILNFILHRYNWRTMTSIFVAFAVVGNVLSIAVLEDFSWLCAMRFITGLGSGGLIAITFTMMGLTRSTDRNFGFIIMAVLTYGGFGILAMPALYSVIGMDGVLIIFAVICAAGALFIRDLPAASPGGADVPQTFLAAAGRHFGVILLAAVLLYNIAIGLVWVYLFNVGTESGMPEQEAAEALTISQFLGIAGAFAAVLAQVKFGRIIPLMVGIVAGAAGIYWVIGDIDGAQYWFGVCLFNFMWNMSMPYILALLAEYDTRGNFVAYGVSMQMLGYAVGPFMAGLIFADYGFDGVNWTAIVLFAASAALFVPALLAVSRQGLDGASPPPLTPPESPTAPGT
ncbi:MAG: MFS transporter [Proteobacteria bacterium]|nr:MFS transporter [Pseudomonadota bacterium]